MPLIDSTQDIVTLINVFEVADVKKQLELIASLERVTVSVMSMLPGYVSASVHRGLDDFHVINYAQWRSLDEFKAMLESPRVQDHLEEVKGLARSITPVLYQVVFTNGGQT